MHGYAQKCIDKLICLLFSTTFSASFEALDMPINALIFNGIAVALMYTISPDRRFTVSKLDKPINDGIFCTYMPDDLSLD